MSGFVRWVRLLPSFHRGDTVLIWLISLFFPEKTSTFRMSSTGLA